MASSFQVTDDDAIEFSLTAERTIVNDTVKLIATISGLVTPGLTEDRLKSEIRGMLGRLVADTTWSFSGINREETPAGLEQVTLQASARVPERENHSLAKRAREVSREGLTVTAVTADSTPPLRLIEQAETESRLYLIEKATKELEAVNGALGGGYRLGSLSFSAAREDTSAKNLSNRAYAQMHLSASTYAGDLGDDNALGNSVRLTMRATVRLLKRFHEPR